MYHLIRHGARAFKIEQKISCRVIDEVSKQFGISFDNYIVAMQQYDY